MQQIWQKRSQQQNKIPEVWGCPQLNAQPKTQIMLNHELKPTNLVIDDKVKAASDMIMRQIWYDKSLLIDSLAGKGRVPMHQDTKDIISRSLISLETWTVLYLDGKTMFPQDEPGLASSVYRD